MPDHSFIGEKPFYHIGDTVRIWRVYKNPIGRVQYISEKDGQFIYRVSYEYHDGRYFAEDFESTDLALVERASKDHCNCGSNSKKHQVWCNISKKWY